MLEGGETSGIVRRREGAREHPHFRRALAARSLRRELEGWAANWLMWSEPGFGLGRLAKTDARLLVDGRNYH
jgi:hypothetical protein